MLDFFVNNGGTILTAMVVIGIVAAIITKLILNKQRGNSSGCGCGCENCPKA